VWSVPRRVILKDILKACIAVSTQGYPLKSELLKRKFEVLMSQLTGEQSYFVKPILKSQAATVASF
jgi:hypothetical protein